MEEATINLVGRTASARGQVGHAAAVLCAGACGRGMLFGRPTCPVPVPMSYWGMRPGERQGTLGLIRAHQGSSGLIHPLCGSIERSPI